MGAGPNIFSSFAIMAVAPSNHDGLVVALLILMVTSVVLTIGVLRFVVRRELVRRAALKRPRKISQLSTALFEAPGRWLAIKTENPHAVEAVLGVNNSRACTWTDALATPFEPRLFISPPVNGWVVVLGCDLPDPTDDVDESFKFLTGLSRKLGEVQFFARNRAVAHHGWVRVQDGRVLRAYVWAGETLWDQGPITQIERDLKLRCLNYTESSTVLGLAEREVLSLNTDRVIRVAAAWSIDPTAVEGTALEGKGIAGDLLHGKLH